MNAYHVGQQVRVWVQFADIDGYAVDPTVITLKVVDPTGALETWVYETDPAVTRVDGGQYYVEFIPTRPGTWRYRWESSGALTAATEGAFQVLRSSFT